MAPGRNSYGIANAVIDPAQRVLTRRRAAAAGVWVVVLVCLALAAVCAVALAQFAGGGA